MQGKAFLAGLMNYLSSLVMTILAPLQWLRILKVAGQHKDMDHRARAKIIVGIVVGIGLAGFATTLVLGFEDDATAGIYDSTSGKLSISLGNEDYNAAVSDRDAARGLIETADDKIAEAQAAGDAEAEQTWRDNRQGFVAQFNDAQARVTQYTPHHQLWQRVDEALTDDQDEDAAQAIIDDFNGDYDDVETRRAFRTHAESIEDMHLLLDLFVYPGLIGVLWAPVAFAVGHIMKTTYVPSESVGFKPYPGGAAALFLLFGAFGIPALFFAAWVMQDFADRTKIGQISL